MPWIPGDRRMRLNLIGAVILLAGLGGSFLIYRQAEPKATEGWGYEAGGGAVYPVQPGDSKKYLRDLELYGGKANVLATELRLWLVGLFQGKTLAFTVAFITIFIALGFFYAAHSLPTTRSPGTRGPDRSDRSE